MMATTMTMTTTTGSARSVGDLLRDWRARRRLSQMALALNAEVSTRHLSFLETGRAQPSREMLIRLSEHLAVPLRERNTLLLAAGYAPAYPERPIDDPSLASARSVIERVLAGHEPFPALAVDRHWSLLAANRAVAPLLARVAPALLQPPVNVLRLSLHPEGLAPRIANLAEWRTHLLARLERQIEASGDPVLRDLLTELRGLGQSEPASGPASSRHDQEASQAGVAIPFQLRTERGLLSFLSTTMVFGAPVDITLSELAIEAFFPADASTAEILASGSEGRTSSDDGQSVRSP